MNRITQALLCASFAFLMLSSYPAQASSQDGSKPDWAAHLELVDRPALELKKRDYGSIEGYARVVVRNSGAEISGKISIECTVFDQAGNTVDTLTGEIGRIRPGKLGIGEVTGVGLSDMAREIDCEIIPGGRFPWRW